MTLNKLAFCGQPGKNAICRRCRYPTQCSDICIHDIRMSFKELLDLLPPHRCLIHFPIAHFITRVNRIHERCFDSWQHKLDKYRGLSSIIGSIDGRIILLLAVMDDGFHRQLGKGRIPLGEQQRMPQAANATVSIGKGVDQFQLIMEHATADQHMHIAVFHPVQQLHDQIRDICRTCPS